ncbi:hypothetical protein OpiT1DRAFT_01274 [Opitutaceae bacterium TAV1]|nr:hypothetical protein OpiT1DRAFT_01274 [Opitutaceae bacterium TAV1]
MLIGVPDEKRTGRLVQVRKGAGAFGSNKYLIRLRDGSLMCFENVLLRHANDERFVEAFYRSNGMTPPTIPDQPPFDGDSEQTEYLIAGGFPETGFIINQPKEPASATQSFAMRIVHAHTQ